MKTKWVVSGVLALFLVAGGLYFKTYTAKKQVMMVQNGYAQELAAQEKDQRMAVAKKQQALKDSVEALVKKYSGTYSVYVYDVNDGAEYTYNNGPMPSASMIKMYILAKAYEEIAAGNLLESEKIILRSSDIVGGAGNIQGMAVGTPLSIQYLLAQMIVESDNIATNLIINKLGMENINRYISEHGYADTKLQRLMMDFQAQAAGRENYTSVQNLGKIFMQLHKHNCVNVTMDKKMLEILKGQTDNDKIPAGLPGGTVVAHKTGELTGVYNDGGIVYATTGDYVLVVMSNRVDGEAINHIADISHVVYKVLSQPPAVASVTVTGVEKPPMLQKPVEWNATRSRLIREYAQLHYGLHTETIEPKAIVLHWTASEGWEGTYNYFYPAEGNYKLSGGKLNVGSHYLVDRDGTIYQLTPENALNRHAIGFNWCAIGVENVGGINGKQDLTEAQVQSNIALVRYLTNKYTTIKYVFGHYQQTQARNTELYVENMPGYSSDKIDPGPVFMGKIHDYFKNSDLKFFKE